MKKIQDRIDFWICRPIVGIPLFFLAMYTVFRISFYGLGIWLTESLETFFFGLKERLEELLLAVGTGQKAASFFLGIFSDVASVLSFLPQTAIFFFLFKCLSDCGYMARAVFATDTLLCRFGLSGNTAVPLALGCGCAVPALTASRELKPDEKNALLFAMPFLICGARLPVLFFLCKEFFPRHRVLAAFSFYLLSVLTVLISSLLSSKGKTAPPLIVKLTDYRLPKAWALLREAGSKSADYLRRTASVIFLCSVLFRLTAAGKALGTESVLYGFGKALSVIFAPLGFGKAPFSAALFAGFFAKENLLFVLEMLSRDEFCTLLTIPGKISFTAFSMLYLPCFSAVCTVWRESGLRKTASLLLRTFFIAYGISAVLYVLSYIAIQCC